MGSVDENRGSFQVNRAKPFPSRVSSARDNNRDNFTHLPAAIYERLCVSLTTSVVLANAAGRDDVVNGLLAVKQLVVSGAIGRRSSVG